MITMKHYTITIDDEQAALLIEMLSEAITVAEQDITGSVESTRMISVGTPVLDDLRAVRGANPTDEKQDNLNHETPDDPAN